MPKSHNTKPKDSIKLHDSQQSTSSTYTRIHRRHKPKIEDKPTWFHRGVMIVAALTILVLNWMGFL